MLDIVRTYRKEQGIGDQVRFFDDARHEEKKVQKQSGQAGASRMQTLELFRSGIEVAAIAQERGLALSTIRGHLAHLVEEGRVKPEELMDQERLESLKHRLPPLPRVR